MPFLLIGVPVTGVKGNVKESGREFAYGEVAKGTNRGIRIAETGVAKSDHEYSLRWKNDQDDGSNLHKSGVYVKREKEFYEKLAEGIAKKVVTQKKWPASRWEFTYRKEQFILELE